MGDKAIIDVDLSGVKVPGPPRLPKTARAVRRDGDTYETPEKLARAIVNRLTANGLSPARIIEPSAGHGSFVAACHLQWPGAQIAAVEPRAECAGALSAVGASAWTGNLEDYPRGPIEEADLVIGNPPYTLAAAHARLLLDSMKPGALLAFLLRINFAGASQGSTDETKARIDLFKKHPLAMLWPIMPRPSFTPDGKTDPTEYAVFVWRKEGIAHRRVFEMVEWEAP